MYSFFLFFFLLLLSEAKIDKTRLMYQTVLKYDDLQPYHNTILRGNNENDDVFYFI
jgi:hypothetical protein